MTIPWREWVKQILFVSGIFALLFAAMGGAGQELQAGITTVTVHVAPPGAVMND